MIYLASWSFKNFEKIISDDDFNDNEKMMNILHSMTESEYDEYLKMRSNMRNHYLNLIPKVVLNLNMNASDQLQ